MEGVSCGKRDTKCIALVYILGQFECRGGGGVGCIAGIRKIARTVL
jgi:hypothetical protein